MGYGEKTLIFALCVLRWIFVSSRLTPSGMIFAPVGVNHTVVVECEVPAGLQPLLAINGHVLWAEEDHIDIRASHNVSVISLTDSGLDEFTGTQNRSGIVSITCIALDGLRNMTDSTNMILRFEKPLAPTRLRVPRKSGRVSWQRPSNSVGQVNVTYRVTAKDQRTGAVVIYENVRQEWLKVKLPGCFEINVTATNGAGISTPASKTNSLNRHRCKFVISVLNEKVLFRWGTCEGCQSAVQR
jgi:hypothetical protein